MPLRLSDHTLGGERVRTKMTLSHWPKMIQERKKGNWASDICLAVFCHHLPQAYSAFTNSAWAWASSQMFMLTFGGGVSPLPLLWQTENIGLYRTNRPLCCVLNKSSTVLVDLIVAYFCVVWRSYAISSYFPGTPGSVSSFYALSHFRSNYCVKA